LEIFDDILKFTIIDVIDVVLVGLLLYYVYKLVKGTVAINIFIGIVIIYLIWKLTQALQMQLLSTILGGFMTAGMFALIVVFQQEIRKFLLMIGSTNIGNRGKLLSQLKMGASKTGALIVLERNNNLDFLVNTGDAMNIEVTQPIIESIFFKNSPLHDGAIIIENNIVIATRVILPVNNEKNIPQRFGLRHRAAVGITERTDAIAIAVSEETGQISCFRNGEFLPFKDTAELTEIIKRDLD